MEQNENKIIDWSLFEDKQRWVFKIPFSKNLSEIEKEEIFDAFKNKMKKYWNG